MNRTLIRTAIAASSFTLLALGACSSTQECSSGCDSKVGSMTIAQAEDLYGEPSSVRYAADGSETWTWDNGKSIQFMDGVAMGSCSK